MCIRSYIVYLFGIASEPVVSTYLHTYITDRILKQYNFEMVMIDRLNRGLMAMERNQGSATRTVV